MIETDIAIIGAGPVGLFAVFEAGLLKWDTPYQKHLVREKQTKDDHHIMLEVIMKHNLLEAVILEKNILLEMI